MNLISVQYFTNAQLNTFQST